MRIPFVINNRNRLSTLQQLLSWLERSNSDVRVIILDNDSTYQPLLDYYAQLPASVQLVRLGANLGHTALYTWGAQKNFPERYFVYTDSDIVPAEQCPLDLIQYLLTAKQAHPAVNKVGVSLEISDLPAHYELKGEVLRWEKKWWQARNGEFWIAKIDTTLAVYDNQNQAGKAHCKENCLRTDYPYVARHLPWYVNSRKLDEEERFYLEHATAKNPDAPDKFLGMWTQQQKRLLELRDKAGRRKIRKEGQ